MNLPEAPYEVDLIELRSLGTAEIHTDIVTITPSQQIIFAAGLYLIVERGRPVSRAGLALLLWPDSPEQTRAHRLRQTILQLKRLGFPVSADRTIVSLPKAEACIDVDTISEVVASALMKGNSLEPLPAYSPSLSRSLSDWIETTRSKFQSSTVAQLVRELTAVRLRGDWRAVENVADNCLSLDPFNEEAVLAKAEAAAMRGSKRNAISILDHYLSELGDTRPDLKIPAAVLRRRVVDRLPDREAILNTDPAFVGRESEMAVLTRAFERARSECGSALLLQGEPGIGKSRLSAELARFAGLRGAQVLRTSCRRADLDRPMSLFVDIVPELREMPGALGCTPQTFSWLRRLTEFERPTDVGSSAVDSELLFENVRAALFDLLESIVEEHCLLLVIEDLQWLDKASAKLLVRMVEWSLKKRVFFLLNARPEKNTFLDYADKLQLDTLWVGPLSPVPATALLRSVAMRPGDELEAGFVEWCLEVAEGNPFFLQELAHQWIETGQRYEAPPSVNKVIQERLSRLSVEGLQLLQTSAILNDFATLGRVERVLGYRPHQLLAAVEELSRAAMLRVSSGACDTMDQIQPRHDFLSSAAIGRLSPISLAFLHRRSADILETDLEKQNISTNLLWSCAAHRHEAGDRDKALSLRMTCAEHLLELGLAADACAAYQTTLEYCVTDSERLGLMSQLSRAFELGGECNRSIAMLRDCATLAARSGASGDTHNDYELLMLNSRHRNALDFLSLLHESLNCVDCERASPRHRVGAAVVAMKVALDFGRWDHVDHIYAQVSPLLQSSEVNELNALELQTIYKTSCGDGLVPVSDLRRLAAVARSTDGELGYSHALVMAASACRLSGRYQEGLQFASDACEHAITHHLQSRRRQTKLSEISLHISAGAFHEARKALTELSGYGFTSDSAKERNEIHMLDARVALEEADLSGAERAFRQVEGVGPTYSIARKGYYLAVEVRIRIMQGACREVIEPLVRELEKAHLQTRHSGLLDFESFALFLGLCAVGEEYRAICLLREYVHLRRANWPLPENIAIALSNAGERGTKKRPSD